MGDGEDSDGNGEGCDVGPFGRPTPQFLDFFRNFHNFLSFFINPLAFSLLISSYPLATHTHTYPDS
jgi:hypothetical protein